MRIDLLARIGAVSTLCLLLAVPAVAQEAPDSLASPSEEVVASEGGGLPVALTLGLGWGVRTDPCVACADPENIDSFSAHLGLHKPLGGGLGVGLDVSVWQRGHPAPEGSVVVGAETTDAEAGPPSLTNRLMNISVSFSYRVRYLYLRAGVGPALGSSDVAESDGNDGFLINTASGGGVGYSVGGGVTLPVAGPIGLAFYANWNSGSYDLNLPTTVLARGAKHQYLEMGVGLSVR